MPNPSLIQLPPDSTGKQVGTWVDGAGKHYHGFVLVDADGDPVRWDYIVNLLERMVIALESQIPEADPRRRTHDR